MVDMVLAICAVRFSCYSDKERKWPKSA